VSQPAAVDVLVVGAGPAGLVAATYLARFRRSVVVADGGEPRAHWIPVSHNMPAFPEGVAGPDILKRLKAQAAEYGAEIRAGCVRHLSQTAEGFRAETEFGPVTARAVLLATGVVDHHPNLPGVEDAVRRALVRICPICDGFEAIGKRVAVIGRDDLGAREAAFIRTYSDNVTLIHAGAPAALTQREGLERLGVALIEAPIDQVQLEGDRVTALGWNGQFEAFDMVYSALGVTPQVELAMEAGCALVEDDGRLSTDDHQQTSVPGLYAAGDVVLGLNQIAVATAEAAVAATAIHNRLRQADGSTLG
jgi:thioredoxin reductase (NADPH)